MSTRRFRSRAVLPKTESLESRELLSALLTGRDTDGDRWVLKLQGLGDLRVTKQPDAAGNPQTLDSLSEIDQITIAGANPLSTRLIGQVRRSASGDGKVFFSSISELGGVAPGNFGNLGIYVIDMPDFWLGQTSTAGTGAAQPTISIPDGIITLRFGGADTTFTPVGGTPLNENGANDTFSINLGIPRTQGTSIIIEKTVTSGQAAATTGGTPTQDSVVFSVAGRINQFLADTIEGNTAFPTTGFQGGGGTIVVSATDQLTQITGQIGYARVGGNATNFSVQTNDKISNFYIGGESNNVLVLAPNGSRALLFGKGMDTVTLLTHTIDSLQTNRGAVNTNIGVDRNVGRVTFGGDVINTTFQTGLEQNLATVFSNQIPPDSPQVQNGGAIRNLLIAGNVTDSIFTASAEPLDGAFGIDDLLLPNGNITAKVGGTIDNAIATPDNPEQAFYAKFVKVFKGPVIPPTIPELPFKNLGAPPSGPRIPHGLQPTQNRRSNLIPRARVQTQAQKAATPKGPAGKSK